MERDKMKEWILLFFVSAVVLLIAAGLIQYHLLLKRQEPARIEVTQ